MPQSRPGAIAPISPPHPAMITGVLALLALFPPVATDMYLSAMGDVAQALNASPAATELSLSVFFLGLCIGQLVMGPLIDGFGRKTPLLAGTLLFTLTSAGLLLVQDVVTFNILRFFQAFGACAGMVVGRAMINDLYTGREAAQKMTVLVMLMTLGPVISPFLGAVLVTGFGWRAIFVAMVLIGAVSLLLAKTVLPETLVPEKRAASPFSSAFGTVRRLLSRSGFVWPALAAACVQGALFAFITGSSGVFQGAFGLSKLEYGLLFAGVAAALGLFGHINSRLLKRFDPAQIVRIGLPIFVLAAFALFTVSGTETIWLLVMPLWVSIGMVGLLSANVISIAMDAAPGVAGIGSALLGGLQFAVAFAVSALVALGSSATAMPMAAGILIPALLAALFWTVSRRRFALVQPTVGES